MAFVKKNLISLICALVAVLALVAVFVWPLDGLFDTLKEKATDRAKVQGKLNAVKNKQRFIPVIDIKTQKPIPLTKFPSQQIITLGENAQKLMRKQSEEMYLYAWKLNQKGHELIDKKVLPLMMDQAAGYSFRKNFIEALSNLRNVELKAGIPPTAEQVKLREDALWEEMKKDIITLPDGTKPNEQVVAAKFDAEKLKLPDVMKKEMASEYKMYIDPTKVFVASPAVLPADTFPTPQAVWSSQVSFWIYSDVVSSIKELNANSSSVLDSPIKNLIALEVPLDPFNVGMGQRIGAADAPADGATSPTGGRPDPTIAIPENVSISPTKRASNNLFDVVSFKMIVDIEADKIPLFLKTIPTNRFITVTRVEMNPVDSQIQQIRGYVYGPRPVVTLTLDCEALFMREWTIAWMPKDIRAALGIPETAAKQ